MKVTTGAMSPAAQARLANRLWRLRASAWLLSPIFALSMGTGISFVYVGVRAKRRDWWLAGVGYFVVAVVAIVCVSLAVDSDSTLMDIGGTLLLVGWIGGVVHAFAINRAWLRFRAQADDARPWWDEHGQQAPQGWNGPTPPPAPAQLGGLGVDPSQFYGTPPLTPAPESQQYPRRDLPTPPVPAPPPAPMRSHNAGPAPYPTPASAPRTVDVNTASADDLAALPGMTPARCDAVLAARSQRGRFNSAEEVAQIAHLAPHELVRIRDKVTFSGTRPSGGTQPGGRVVDF